MKRVRRAAVVCIAGLLAVLFALPILVTVTNSFMSGFEIFNRYTINVTPANIFYRFEFLPQVHFVRVSLIPSWVSLGQFAALFRNVGYMDAFWNSIIITLPAIMGQIFICVPAAYAFEFGKWRHKEKLFFVYLMVMLMPLPVILVPQFVIALFLGIDQSILAIILPAIFAPFGVFLLRQFLKTLPVEFIEAAKIDGANHVRILISIILPLLKPAVAALAMLVFIDYWNVVDQAIVFITNPQMMPLSVYLARLTGEHHFIFAASFFYMIPALLVFLHGQEQLIGGMRLSGLK